MRMNDACVDMLKIGLKATTMAAMLAVLPACEKAMTTLNFGHADKVPQNQKDMQNAIERFIAESDSAADSSVAQLGRNMSSMRQYMLDLKQITPLKECASFQSEALSKMDEIIESWSSIGSPDCDVGSPFFDFCMQNWKIDLFRKASSADCPSSGNLRLQAA